MSERSGLRLVLYFGGYPVYQVHWSDGRARNLAFRLIFFVIDLSMASEDNFVRAKANMRRNWLNSAKGESFIATGTYAIMFSLAIFTPLDFWILLTGRLVSFHRPMGLWCLFWAAVAGLFSAVLVCTGKPFVPRIMIGLFSVSMASHVIEQFVVSPPRQLKLLAFCRILVALVLVLLVVIGRAKGKKSLLEWLRTRSRNSGRRETTSPG